MKYVGENKYYNQDVIISNKNNVYNSNKNCNNQVEVEENCTMPLNNCNDNYNCNYQHEEGNCKPHNDDCNCNNNHNDDCNCKPHHDDCNCNHHQDDCNCNHHYDDCYDDFCNIPDTDNCCTGIHCKINPSALKCICTYLDIIYSECNALGTPILIPIVAENSTGNTITEKYKPCSKCCHPCPVDDSSVFTIEKMNVCISNLTLTTPPDASDILVNGTPVISVTPQPDGSYTALISPSLNNELCSKRCLGTNVSVLLNSIGGWSFLAKYELCGKVTTTEGICKFAITIESLNTVPVTTEDMSTFVCSKICLPSSKDDDTPYLKIKFNGNAQLLNPSLSIVNDELQLDATLLLNPCSKLEMIENTKVCLNGMIRNNNK